MSGYPDIRLDISENLDYFINSTSSKYKNVDKLFLTICKRIASGLGSPMSNKKNLFHIKLNDSSPHLDYPIALAVFFSREAKIKDDKTYVNIVIKYIIFLDIQNNERTGCSR